MNLLTLDLGTKTGWACGAGENLFAGTWNLSTAREISEAAKARLDRRCDPRINRLFDHVRDIVWRIKPKFIVFEDVQFSTFTCQTQLWSSLRAAVWLANTAYPMATFECVPVTTLKKFTTGQGSATKETMRRCVETHFRLNSTLDFKKLDDNAIDALALWVWAERNLSRTP